MSKKNEPRIQVIENATRDDVRPGDHLTWTRVREHGGVITKTSREGIAYRCDRDGNWHPEGGAWITWGEGEDITLTIRRPITEEG